MKSEDKKTVAGTYGVGYTYFESWIESIVSEITGYGLPLCISRLVPHDLR